MINIDPMITQEKIEYLADILIVDDTPDNLRVLTNLLSSNRYKVRKVINGELALDATQLSPPDLILLDIMMPGIDGYEVCRRMKESERTANIPIIFLTARDQTLDKVQGFTIGGVDYITKPYQVTEVLARVENHLKLSRLQKQLLNKNLQLQQEISDRIVAETALKKLNKELETIVETRTSQLIAQNQQLRSLQDQLQEALTQEQYFNELKTQLLNTICHQFRTPLTVISTSAALVRHKISKGNTGGCDRFFQKIDENVQAISESLEDVLMLARANSNNIKLQLTSLQLNQFCQDIVTRYKLPEHGQYQLLFSSIGKQMDEFYADAHLLQKILSHLLMNAIRFSPAGGNVLLEVIYELNSVTFRLSDHGIGIPEEDQPKVFDSFYRASNANSIPGTPGTGLGLAIVKWAVEIHKGNIFLQSKLNQGTTVIFSLPYRF